MIASFTTLPPATTAVLFAAIGLVVGWLIDLWCDRLLVPSDGLEAATVTGQLSDRRNPLGRVAISAATAVLFGAFVYAQLVWQTQKVDEVRPDEFWKYGRILYHLALIVLLVAATIADLRDYTIPDAVTLPAVILGVGIATLSGDLQMMHLWVDANAEIPRLRGPFIPEWIKA
ncbi:MAG: prepilin peptidase, partial [Planctomycetes bacterium]|nr:prepilin peptidase [Planctomycetota bacterium]